MRENHNHPNPMRMRMLQQGFQTSTLLSAPPKRLPLSFVTPIASELAFLSLSLAQNDQWLITFSLSLSLSLLLFVCTTTVVFECEIPTFALKTRCLIRLLQTHPSSLQPVFTVALALRHILRFQLEIVVPMK